MSHAKFLFAGKTIGIGRKFYILNMLFSPKVVDFDTAITDICNLRTKLHTKTHHNTIF